jgi:hypothetical protein
LRNRFEFPILAAAEAIEAVRETERLSGLKNASRRSKHAYPVAAIPGTLGTSREADIVRPSK